MPQALPSATIELVKALYLQGFAQPQVAKQTGVNLHTVRGYVTRLGLRSIRDRTKASLEQAAKPGLALSTARDLARESAQLKEALSDELLGQAAALKTKPAKLTDLANNPERQGRAAVVKTIVEAAAKVHGWDAQGQANVQVNILNKIMPIDRSKQEQEAKLDVETVPQE